MSKHRIKLSTPALKTRAQMEECVGQLRDLVIERNRLQLDAEAAHKAVDDKFGPPLAAYGKQIEERYELIRAWAEANPSEFGGRKSLEVTHGQLGWRTGQPTLKTLTGWTWDRVLEKLKSLPGLSHYLRVKEEVNKQAILNDREGMGPDALRNLGVRVVQDEVFYVEPRLDEPTNAQVSAA